MNNGKSKFLALSSKPDACRPFAQMYNGKLYAKNDYHGKLAAAVKYFDFKTQRQIASETKQIFQEKLEELKAK